MQRCDCHFIKPSSYWELHNCDFQLTENIKRMFSQCSTRTMNYIIENSKNICCSSVLLHEIADFMFPKTLEVMQKTNTPTKNSLAFRQFTADFDYE